MALDSYSALKTEIADELNRSDLSDTTLSRWILMAEAQINRRLIENGPVRQMLGRSDSTINSEFIAVPSDFLGPRAIYLGGNYSPIDYVEPENIVERKTLYPNESGDPQIWSVVGGEFQFWPWNGGSFAGGELTYWKALPALSATNATNWLLASHPDAYFYGALTQSGTYLKDTTMLPTYSTIFQTVLADIVEADKVSRFAPHLEISRVKGTTP